MQYALLKGRARDGKPWSQDPHKRPHYHILVEAAGRQYDVAVNIASDSPQPSQVQVLYRLDRGVTLPTRDQLRALPDGMRNLSSKHDRLGLDFVAQNLVSRDQMALLPLWDPQNPSRAQNGISLLIDAARADGEASVYLFGHRYKHAPAGSVNPCWEFSPDDGIHNIHMNQGNKRGDHDNENGRYTDGALIVYLAVSDTWNAVYVAFQNQSWDNDDRGYPSAG
jgi:uncharacterized protein YukJ